MTGESIRRYSRPALVVDAQRFRVSAADPPPAMVVRVLRDTVGNVYGEHVAGTPVPFGFTPGFAVWMRAGWRLVMDGDWVVTRASGQFEVWTHERFTETFTAIEVHELRS